MKLPEIFEARMTELLGNEYPDFRASLDGQPFYGLRVNTLKVSVERFLELMPFSLRPIPWVPEGFYFDEGDRVSKHPYYHAGLFYIQEPSAMLPAVLLDPQPGEVVLDTCAAPGGKTCQIGARLKNQGLLLTNDISASRGKALVHNVEISGVKNAIVLCVDPPKLIPRFSGKVDRILVDAPCSGEGMFRKSDGAVKAWDPGSQEVYAALQKPLLDAAGELLAPGGTLVYSTCTFNTVENEGLIYDFLQEHGDFEQAPMLIPGIQKGFPGKDGTVAESLYRLWPHRALGEGHFAARLKKAPGEKSPGRHKPHDLGEPPEFTEFVSRYLPGWHAEGIYRRIDDRVMLVPDHGMDFSGLRVLREGWYLGDIKKGRFEPSQAFAMGLDPSDFSQCLDFDPEDPELIRYIKGETLHLDAPLGWILMTVSGFPLGWAKGVSGFIKNHYPAPWRRLD